MSLVIVNLSETVLAGVLDEEILVDRKDCTKERLVPASEPHHCESDFYGAVTTSEPADPVAAGGLVWVEELTLANFEALSMPAIGVMISRL